MTNPPCGSDAFVYHLEEQVARPGEPLPELSEPSCSGCAHAVENGGKCCESDAEWMRVLEPMLETDLWRAEKEKGVRGD